VVADLQLVHEGRKAELLRQELVAVLHAEVIEDLDGDGVERTRQTAQHIAKAAVGSGIVLRPVAVFVQRRVLVDCRGRDDPGVQCRRVDSHRLERRARRLLALRGAVERQAAALVADTARHGDDVAGLVVRHNDGGLQLLNAHGLRHVVKVLVDLVYNSLNLRIDRCIDLIAARQELLLCGKLTVAVALHKRINDIAPYRIDKIRVIVVLVDGVVCLAALRAEILAVRLRVLRARTGEAAARTGVFLLVIRSVAEDHFLIDGGLIGLLRLNIALIVHFLQDRELTLAVVLLADIGIVERGIVRDGDEAGALGRRQVGDLLAKVDACRTLDTVAALTEVDRVEIPLHDLGLRIALFDLQGAEDLLYLAVDRDLILL